MDIYFFAILYTLLIILKYFNQLSLYLYLYVKYLWIDYEWCIALNRACLRLLGIWPEAHETALKALITNIRIVLMLILLIWSCNIPMFHSLVRIWGDMTLMINNLQYSLPMLIAILKFVLLWQKKRGTFFNTYYYASSKLSKLIYINNDIFYFFYYKIVRGNKFSFLLNYIIIPNIIL